MVSESCLYVNGEPQTSDGSSSTTALTAGVGIGVGAVLLIVILVLVFCYCRRKRSREFKKEETPASQPNVYKNSVSYDDGIYETVNYAVGTSQLF